MQHRTVTEVMTHPVVTAHPDSSFKQIAQLLRDNDITAVPVIDGEGHPVGVVSEADLLRKAASLPDPEGRPVGHRFSLDELARASAETAEAMMSTPVVTARPGWNVVETARAMYRHKVKRLPVVDDVGKLVGIVSRSDLLRPFLRTDSAISDEIHRDVLGATLGIRPGTIRVDVREGVVALTGRVAERSLIPVVERLCRSVDGVVAVHQSLGYTYDDLGSDLEPPRLRSTRDRGHQATSHHG
ncbi:CBS domain-containing protein [Streptomyces gibsoniae]|uniref:CBS domain-containing protein n=1 Tax=Streptomyces gibsoniae TaxID=3075529 RepID=A0ABU2U2E3_9ACTN|nr:CBS domain-containing protein [Streptomyces sp. DSM 41699]MDT0467393.1 CBS domain-containing protein [Streptomyces sp. DSM 41699]